MAKPLGEKYYCGWTIFAGSSFRLSADEVVPMDTADNPLVQLLVAQQVPKEQPKDRGR